MATTRDALFTRLINALRGVWRGGRDLQADRDLAIDTIRQIAQLDAASNDIAERLTQTVVDLQQLPSNQVKRRIEVEKIANRVKAIQPHLGVGDDAGEIGKLNSALGEKRAGRPAPAKPRTPSPITPQPPDAPITSLKGVASRTADLIATVIHGPAKPGETHSVTIEDVLRIAPRRYIDYSNLAKIGELLSPVDDVTVEGEIIDIREQYGGRPRVTARLTDGTGTLSLVWFSTFIAKQISEGDRIYASGTIRPAYGRGLEIVSPEWERVGGPALSTGRLAPVYPLTKGLYQKNMRAITRNALDATRNRLVDWLADARDYLPAGLDLLPIDTTYERLHYPESMDEVAGAKRRLLFENLLLLQLGLLERKRRVQSSTAKALIVTPEQLNAYKGAMPFTLTGAQDRAINDIVADLSKPQPMTRLLQGDVGSGKTAVAAVAALIARANGKQTALMAPTELLAEQHIQSLEKLFRTLGDDQPHSALLTGSTKAKQRREIDARLQAGEIDILVGTHALVQDAVTFKDLALVVLDEQHRFGVRQRALLAAKAHGNQPHVLSMTATPIPRTLNFVLSGDLDVSVMDEQPKGRIPIKTRVYADSHREDAYRLVREEVAKGHQVFVICPLVEESEAIEAKAAVDEAERLQTEVFPELRVDVVHGRMSASKKDQVMTDFRDRTFDILVSTSVIEVGIDIPNATVMMIEGADRFGLAQLHQFRGRVGRGAAQSYCILLATNISQDGNLRLKTMEATNDGFVLAQQDLEMRGPGDFIGTRQSGLPELSWLDQGFDTRLLDTARATAGAIVDASPNVDIRQFPRLKPRLQQFWASATVLDAAKS